MIFFTPETDLHRRLSNYVKQRYRKLLIYLQVTVFLYCIGRLVTNYCYKEWITGSLWGGLGIVGPIVAAQVVPVANRTWLRSKRDIILAHIREKIGVAVVTAGIGYFIGRNLVSDDPNHIIFIGGVDITIVCLAFKIIFTEWHSFAMLNMAILLGLIIQAWSIQSYALVTKINITVKYMTTIIIITIFQYLEDRSFKELFSLKAKLEDKDSMHKDILNIVPEGIFILSEKLDLVYSNKYFKSVMLIVPDENSISIEEFLPQVTNLQEITADENCQARLNSHEQTMEKDLRYIVTNFRSILEPVKSQNVINEGFQEESNKAPPILVPQNLNKAHCVFRGLYRSKNDTETVEIKLMWIIFEGQLSILVAIRQAPELALLKQLERAGRYKDEILASVSHELRTPINSNINFLYEALKDEGVAPHVKENLLDPAYKSAKLLLNLVNDILDISQIKERKLRLVSQVSDVRGIIKECHYLFDYQCRKKKINLEYVIENQVPKKIRTDPNRLTQIILNLLSNSYKFTYEGSIKITVAMEESGLIKISVSDTGIGIKEEDKAKLMKKFEKIDLGDKAASNSTGCGLGLSIANSLAQMLGPDESEKGGLKFDSEWGKGTTVTFLLKSRKEFTTSSYNNSYKGTTACEPKKVLVKDEQTILEHEFGSEVCLGVDLSEFFIEEDQIAIPISPSCKMRRRISSTYSDHSNYIEESAKFDNDINSPDLLLRPTTHRISQTAPPCQCPKVMIVDDDGFNILTLETMLKSLDIESDTALSGTECLKKISQAEKCSPNCGRFSLILMDRNMPMKDGIQTTDELLAWNASIANKWDIVIVGCTAHNEKEKQDEFLNAGALETLQKPLVKADLVKLIARYKCI